MTATSNLQAAAGQARKNYRDVTNPDRTVTAIVALASFALVAAIILGMI